SITFSRTHWKGPRRSATSPFAACVFQDVGGIRSLVVAGVQTCALPIWQAAGLFAAGRDCALRLASGGEQPRGLLPTNFQPVEIPSWGHMSGHASIVRCGRLSIVTVLRETQ